MRQPFHARTMSLPPRWATGLVRVAVIAAAGVLAPSLHADDGVRALVEQSEAQVRIDPEDSARLAERALERLRREVPLGRLVSADEDALFAAYLASDAAACFVGQVFPVAGGWTG
jgi:NAD(P)-dependent dehydrogenase (short-subunit alcohol dehydrogenase family)